MTLFFSEPVAEKIIEMVENNEPSAKIADYIQETAMNETDLRYLICVALIATGRGV